MEKELRLVGGKPKNSRTSSILILEGKPVGFELFLYHAFLCIMDFTKEVIVLRHIIGFQGEFKSKKKYVGLLFILIFVALCVWLIPEKYISLMYFPIILVAMHIVIKMNNLPRILIAFIAFVCICELDYFIGAMMSLFSNNGLANIQPFMASAASEVVLSILACFCFKFDISFYKKNYGKKKTFIIIEVAVLFINLAIMGSLFGILSRGTGGTYGIILLVAGISLSMLLSVITLIFYSSLMNVKEYRTMNAMNEEQLQRQKEHYIRLREMDRETRKFRHDISNHFTIIENFMKNQQYDKAEDYLSEVSTHIDNIRPVISVGNEIMNAILNEKYSRCQEKHIRMKVMGSVHEELSLSNYDLCTILSNALDNAIEACEKIEAGTERIIDVQIGVHSQFLNIVITNSVGEKIKIKSCKRDKRNHGFGLINIQESVEKNDGQIQIIPMDGKFKMDIVVKAL